MGASRGTDYVVMADTRGGRRGASGTKLERREGLCNTLFVRTTGSGHLGGHIVLAGWPAFKPCQQPPNPLFPEYIFRPSTMPSFTLKGASGRYIGGSGKRTRLRWILSCSMPLLANLGGMKEVHVLRMGEPLVSRNRRAEIDVQLRHLPRPRVRQGSY